MIDSECNDLHAKLDELKAKLREHLSHQDQLFYSWCDPYLKDPKGVIAVEAGKKMNEWHRAYDQIVAEIEGLILG